MFEVSKIELWAHKTQRGYSGIFCAQIYINGSSERSARIDCDHNLYKVDFKPTQETKISGLNDLMSKNLNVDFFLAHDKTVLM